MTRVLLRAVVAFTLLGAAVIHAVQAPSHLAQWWAAGAAIAYALSSAWHFWEHLQLRDPAAPHVLVATGKAAILAGAVSATVVTPRRRLRATG
jgi:hypothetical protein